MQNRYNPTIALVAAFLAASPAWSALPAPALYGRQVCLAPDSGAALSALAETLAGRLENMTGLEFGIATNRFSGDGLFLLAASPDLADRYPDLAPQHSNLTALAARGPEAFYLFSPGSNHVYVVGNSDAAVSLGVNDSLWRLGRRSLLPGPNWTIEPDLSSIAMPLNATVEPSFRMRTFFGTGGFGGSLPLDPDRQAEADWRRWKTENQFGGAIAIGGHAGESFNVRNATVLQGDPAMRAYSLYPTQHVDYSPSMKPDAAYAPLQSLYVSDRLAAYAPSTYAISVEPADGGGFCVCPVCTQFDPVSSQVFGLARRVADALHTAHPGAMVSLFAYNMHAGIPADPAVRAWLADPSANVYVSVIPYAFQRTGLDGDELAAAWAAFKPNNRGIYDYWAIPDWASDMPNESFDRDEGKVRHWRSLGYDGLLAESTTSAGAVGVLWYATGRLLFDSAADPASLRDEFYALSFGSAASPMKRMIERWGSGFMLTEQELGLSFLDVAAARDRAAGDPASLARVNDYGRYVHYIRLWQEYQRAAARHPVGHAVRHAAAEAVLRFIWQIRSSDMVHAYRMNELIRNRYETADSALNADWNPALSGAAGWAWCKTNALLEEGIALLVSNGVADYATAPGHVPFSQPAYSGQLVPLDPGYSLDGQLTAEARNIYGSAVFLFHVKTGIASLDFQITPGALGNPDTLDDVQVRDPSGATVYSNSFGGNGVFGSNGVPVRFTVPTATQGLYTLRVSDPKKSFILAADRNLPFVLSGPLTSTYQIGQKARFYVPRGLSTLGLHAPGALAIGVRDGGGAVVNPSFGDGIGESDYPVSAEQGGSVWSLENLKCYAPGATPLNIPPYWGFSPTGMLIPSNAPPSVDAGPDSLVAAPAASAALAGIVTDDHLSPAPFASNRWTRVSGPETVLFDDASAAETVASFSTTGTYVLRLEAIDTAGLAATDDVAVTVLAEAPNSPPVVDVGTNRATAFPLAALSLEGTLSDDGKPAPPGLQCRWTEVHGPGTADFSTPESNHTAVTFDKPGAYRLRLTVSDGQAQAHDELIVTVVEDYSDPVYAVGDSGCFGAPTGFDYIGIGLTFDATGKHYAARFRTWDGAAVDRVYQRLIGVDSNTTVQIGIMGDKGDGTPLPPFLASTRPDLHPADGAAWAVFTNTAVLEPSRLYHVVTRVTALGPGESFYVYRSSGHLSIRPYDRASDAFLNSLTSTDSGLSWTVQPYNPYFTLGLGAAVMAGPGNAEQTAPVNNLLTQGGTGRAAGQRFVITTREIPAGCRVAVDSLTLTVYKVNALHDLVVKLRRGDGGVLAAMTRPASALAASAAACSWSFEGQAPVFLYPGQPYYLTTEMGTGSGSGEYFYFKSIAADAATRANSWGGTDVCVPIQSAAGNGWNALDWASQPPYPSRDYQDMLVELAGRVQFRPADSVGDGIADAWRALHFGGDGDATNALSAADGDPDADGFPNLKEYLCGSDPTNPASVFRITGMNAVSGGVHLSWQLGAGRTAVVQSAINPGGLFSNVSPLIVAPLLNDATNAFQDAVGPCVEPRFYRIHLVP